jgi:hypothetical protein
MISRIHAFRLATLCLAGLASAGDTGVSPKPKPTDYPVHDSVKTAILAAAIVPPDQVKKMFSADTAKNYVVVEVAIYPEDNRTFQVDLIDFELNTGDQFVRASEPADIGTIWPSAKAPSIGGGGPNVTTETGVILARETDPATGRPRTSVGTYEGVAVSNYPRQDPPPPPQRPSPSQSDIDSKILRMALRVGPTKDPIAGYLYFRHQKRKQDTFTLNYANDDFSVDLKFPK